jgi:hypothetical protein
VIRALAHDRSAGDAPTRLMRSRRPIVVTDAEIAAARVPARGRRAADPAAPRVQKQCSSAGRRSRSMSWRGYASDH